MYRNAIDEGRRIPASRTQIPLSDGEQLLQEAKKIKGIYDTDPGLKVSDGRDGRFNCTTYVETILRRGGFDVTRAMSKQININLPEGTNLRRLLESPADPRMTGVVRALVDSDQGTMITNRSDCKVGDLLQMWDGAKGHAGIIERTDGKNFVLWGAHESLGKVGSNSYRFGDWDHLWCVRPSKK